MMMIKDEEEQAPCITNPGDWQMINRPWKFSGHARDQIRKRFGLDDDGFHELETNLIEERFVQVPENDPREGFYVVQTTVAGVSMFMVIAFGDKIVVTVIPPFCHFAGELAEDETNRYKIKDAVSLCPVVKTGARVDRSRGMISIAQTFYEIGEREDEHDLERIKYFKKEADAEKARVYLKWKGGPVKKSVSVDIFESFDEFKNLHLKKVAEDVLAKLTPEERAAIEARFSVGSE